MSQQVAEQPIRLTNAQIAHYHDLGYVVVEDLVSTDKVEQLCSRVREYTHGNRDRGPIYVQMEPQIEKGELTVEHPGDGIRKIEGLVQHDDLFQGLGLNSNIVNIVEQILGPDLKMFRNALMLKPPRVGSAKCPHQDSPYWPIEPMALCSCWFALDDATPENGCMGVLPGWHTKGTLKHVGQGDHLEIETSIYDMNQQKLAPMPAGAGLFFHSLLPHYTAPNTSDNWRRAIALSYMSAKSKYTGQGGGPVYFHVKGETYPDCVR